MKMILPASISATPNGTTRPQVRIVIVGHVDHGKSTLVGRLLHETKSLPEGKLEMLKAVSARRGMPFEWSFLLDALQTERDQGITIDTTQIRFRTGSRDIVLIDAPGHAEFLRNMITGASQADGAVLIIDALEGVRDQTRRHGYLLHLLGVKQVAVVVNKMDRVEFSAARFREISENHLRGLLWHERKTALRQDSASSRDQSRFRKGPAKIDADGVVHAPLPKCQQHHRQNPAQNSRFRADAQPFASQPRIKCDQHDGAAYHDRKNRICR